MRQSKRIRSFLVLVGAFLLAPCARAQESATAKRSGSDELVAEARRVDAAREAAEKGAIAESILVHEEGASLRPFDPVYRAEAKKALVALPMSTLAEQTKKSGIGVLNLGDSQADLVFTPVTPCRVFDTRNAGGMIVPGANRSLKVTGDTTSQGGANCGIPFGTATAVMLNFVAVSPAGPGDFRVTPFGATMPLASFVNYAPVAGLGAIANGLSVTTCDPAVSTCTYDITVQADVSGAHLLADVTGYFRSLRKEQVKSISSMVRTGGTTALGTSCTNYSSLVLSMFAPAAGHIHVRANVNLRLNHVNGTNSEVDVVVASLGAVCGGTYGYDEFAYLPSSMPTGVNYVWIHPSKSFPAAAGTTYSFFVNAVSVSGTGHELYFGALEATFVPD